ncbi:MAG: LptE family protein [Candidatus Schekmanbacteria bacterium]|nr:LptE family protein [Candidatus Schekmanbacteria bacterium]
MSSCRRRRACRRFPLISLAAFLVSCASLSCGYVLVGKGVYLPPHVQKVAVPLIQSTAFYYQLASNLTFELSDQLSNHKELTVVPVEQADAVLDGQIVLYQFQPVNVDQAGTVKTYRITIRAKFVFRDLVRKEVLWENRDYAYSKDYELPADLGSREKTELEAREEIVRDLAETIITQILEGF